MRRVADWQLHRIAEYPTTDWTFATLDIGVLAAADSLEPTDHADAERYRRAVRQLGEKVGWKLGPRATHADDQAIGQAYLALSAVDHNDREIAALQEQFKRLAAQPEDPAEVTWWWCDALFMAPPIWAQLAARTGDPTYTAVMDRQWRVTDRLLWDTGEHLFFRDKTYLARHERNGRKLFWSRGNGWVMAGLVRVLEALPANAPSRPFYEQRLREMASSIAALQGKDGLWRPGLLDAAAYPLPEVSGSAFFTYALAAGIRTGVLDRAVYLPVVQRAWAGLVSHIYQDGRLGSIQPIGASPGELKASSSYVFGVGAFLLAGSEVLRIESSAPRRRPKGIP